MIISEARRCIRCLSKLKEDGDCYVCTACGLSFSRKDVGSMLHGKRFESAI